jgi:TonB family protein
MRQIVVVLSAILAVGAVNVSAQNPLPQEINGGILNGKAVKLVKPAYPDDVKASKIEGTVLVDVVVDENGNVASAAAVTEPVKIPQRDGTVKEFEPANPILRDAAEKAALESKFAPTLLQGQPIKVRGRIVYVFKADEPLEANGKAISGGVLNSRAVQLPIPDYPAAAAAVGAEGSVNVQVTVDEAGNVISAQAVSGHPLLQSAAVAAAREAKFAPTRLSGAPVKVTGVIVYNFTVQKPNPQ